MNISLNIGIRRLAVGSSWKSVFLALASILVCRAELQAGADARAASVPLRIICFGAHPDDCELQIGGTAALWAARGHKVKFVSVTNGDIGHW